MNNLPPGVTESMIPGNRPEDGAIEAAEENLLDSLATESLTAAEYEIVYRAGLAAVKAHREVTKEIVQDVRADEGLYVEHLKDKIIKLGGDPED